MQKLYDICVTVRNQVCMGKHAVGRVIARPFAGTIGAFKRTPNRHDYSLQPIGLTMLDRLKEAHYDVIGVGKIGDIFAQRGLTASYGTKSNDAGMQKIIELLQQDSKGLIFANLVEFDSLYGHRRDVAGYAQALMDFDVQLAQIIGQLKPTDLLMITADHGCDPTIQGTDHTREYVPLLVYRGEPGRDLGVRKTFADVSATVLTNFHLPILQYGESFL